MWCKTLKCGECQNTLFSYRKAVFGLGLEPWTLNPEAVIVGEQLKGCGAIENNKLRLSATKPWSSLSFCFRSQRSFSDGQLNTKLSVQGAKNNFSAAKKLILAFSTLFGVEKVQGLGCSKYQGSGVSPSFPLTRRLSRMPKTTFQQLKSLFWHSPHCLLLCGKGWGFRLSGLVLSIRVRVSV